jgi:DnaJ-class molecular chaperone
MAQKPFISKRIYNELCNKCHGKGFIVKEGEDSSETCPTCQGTGKVKITKETSILIEPLK